MAAASESINLSQTVDAGTPRLVRGGRRRHLSTSEYSSFQELRAQYLALDRSSDHLDAQHVADLIVRRDSAGLPVSHDDINSLETVLVRLESAPRVREWFRAMRRVYSQVSGVPLNSFTADTVDEPSLRAAAEQMLSDLHTVMTSWKRNQELCARLFRTILESTVLLIASLIILGVFCCLTSGMYYDGSFKGSLWWKIIWTIPYLPALFYSMMAGAAGAFLSSVLRVQNLAARQPLLLPASQDPSLLSAALAPLFGAAAGFLIFSCLACHLIPLEQQFLPVLTMPDPARWHPFHGVLALAPADILSRLKILLAGLAGGFSERLFPDVMDWMAKGIVPIKQASKN
ncbi:MAG TPA: hypothetical protein VKS22_04410 [Candidatus Binataceae bacterium]|nr:hypothetical protein [Candidatus Binataceae bacterium]